METSDGFCYHCLQFCHMDDHLCLPENEKKIMLKSEILNPTLISIIHNLILLLGKYCV